MPLTFSCPCGEQLEVEGEYAESPVSCPACSGVMNPAAPPESDGPAIPVVNGWLVGSYAAVLIAVGWLIVGLMGGRFLVYPLVLIGAGMACFVRGVAAQKRD